MGLIGNLRDARLLAVGLAIAGVVSSTESIVAQGFMISPSPRIKVSPYSRALPDLSPPPRFEFSPSPQFDLTPRLDFTPSPRLDNPGRPPFVSRPPIIPSTPAIQWNGPGRF